jgi:flagellar protein FliS
MAMMHSGGAAALREYQRIKVDSQVEGATPHRLIQLLMERALAKMALAKSHMEGDNVTEKCHLIGDAIDIISALQQCLNYKADENLAGNFDALYDYMLRRLLQANLVNDPLILNEVSGLLGEIKEAWDVIEDKE